MVDEMPPQVIRCQDIESQPWRNGGGLTRELLTWPSADECDVRIAVADIAADGPFSSYEGVQRWIAVISGTGIELSFNDGDRQLLTGDEPLCFDGADAPGCRLLDGPTRDLNLMVRNGRGVMRKVTSSVAWNERFAMRGLFAATSGEWTAGDERVAMPAMTLLWDGSATPREWSFHSGEPSSETRAWWLGFTPIAGAR